MWSGPRNISTALMRSWESRADTAVVDEPLYAFYLKETGLPHPGREAILQSQPTGWKTVVEQLSGAIPGDKAIFYQKHMAHHLLPRVGREWLSGLHHAFLIRDPAEMIPSLMRVWPNADYEDTGLPQQLQLFREVEQGTGTPPPVLDARDLLTDPPGVLASLCEALGVPFDAAMLAWPTGKRDTDGIWAKHWYDAVNRSTGFLPYRRKDEKLPASMAELHRQCREHYEELSRHKLRPE